MSSTRRVRLCVLLAVLVLLAESADTRAQQRLTCVPIRADETVAAVAKRITGEARNMQASWFQIVNPTTSRWVPKARYGLRFAGWNACIVDQAPPNPVSHRMLPVARMESSVASDRTLPLMRIDSSVASDRTLPLMRIDSSVFTRGIAFVWCIVVLSIIAFCIADDYFRQRERVLRTMQRFADRFIQEFERPLIQEHLPDRPIQSRVRFKPGRSRLDVLLAPNAGLRYPNLTDHRRNVIYDVSRVREVLQDQAFVSSQPYARGRWVVVPFQLRIHVREAGGR